MGENKGNNYKFWEEIFFVVFLMGKTSLFKIAIKLKREHLFKRGNKLQ